MYTFKDKFGKTVLVIQIPKNASLTIGTILYKKFDSVYYNLWDSYYNDHIPFVYGKNIVNFDYSISFVRHPYSRTLSRFSYLKTNPYDKDFFKNYNFEDFILKKPSPINNAWMPWSWREQVEYITIDGKLSVDQIYKLEEISINDVFSELLGTTIYETRENRSYSEKYEELLTDKLKKQIYEIYKNDFNMLGYEK